MFRLNTGKPFVRKSKMNLFTELGHHRIMGQALSVRDFVSSESVENAGILDVFPIFHTARLEQKIPRKPKPPLCGVALGEPVKTGSPYL